MEKHKHCTEFFYRNQLFGFRSFKEREQAIQAARAWVAKHREHTASVETVGEGTEVFARPASARCVLPPEGLSQAERAGSFQGSHPPVLAERPATIDEVTPELPPLPYDDD